MITINDSQKVNLTLKPVAINGNPAPLAGVPLWNTSTGPVGSLIVAPDGMSASFVATSLGTTTVSALGNADLSGGTRELTASIDITVSPSEAVSMTIEAGTPEDNV